MTNIRARVVSGNSALLVALFGGSVLAAPAEAAPLPSAAAQASCGDTSGFEVVALSSLPAEATDTYNLIQQGGPYPYFQDGTVFQNREGLLRVSSSSM